MIDNLFLIIMIEQEEAVFMLLIDQVYQRLYNISKYNAVSTGMQQFCNESAPDLACSKMHCCFHSFSF